MELILSDLRIPIEKDGMDEYVKAASQQLEIDAGNIFIAKILSKCLDVRNKKQFYYKISLIVRTSDSFQNKQNFPVYSEPIKANRKTTSIKDRPVIGRNKGGHPIILLSSIKSAFSINVLIQ